MVSTAPGASAETRTPVPHRLVGERPGQREHEGFGCGIGRLIGHRHEAFDRGDVENAAALAGDHAGKKAAHEIDHRARIEIDDLAQRRRILVLEEARRHDRGIVDENVGVEAAAGERLLNRIAALDRAEIGRDELHLDIVRLGERLGGLGKRRLVARDKKEGVARAGELLGQRPADPLRCAGDDDRGGGLQPSC